VTSKSGTYAFIHDNAVFMCSLSFYAVNVYQGA
jgi:hypothetical protein